jgi:antirestriction protein ArdC
LTHSTGHASRLKRETLTQAVKFGDTNYSKEELVAEMGAAFLAGLTGIDLVTIPNNAAYLNSWIRRLKGEPRLVISAAAQAQKAVDYILNRN